MGLTTQNRLAEEAQRIILGGNPTQDREVRKSQLVLYVQECFGSIVRRLFFESKADGDPMVNGDFIYSFDNVEVKKDNAKDMYYSDIPGSTITLPHDLGFYHVSYQKDQRNAFVPLRNGMMTILHGLEAENLGGRQGFYPEQDRIYYPNMCPEDSAKPVLMKLVVPLGALESSDHVNIPLDIQHEIVQKTVEMYMVQANNPKDFENDNMK